MVLNIDLRRAFEKNNLDEERIRIAGQSRTPQDTTRRTRARVALWRTIKRLARYLVESPSTLPILENPNTAVTLVRSIFFAVAALVL